MVFQLLRLKLLSELLKTFPSYTASIKDERYNHEPGCQLGTLKKQSSVEYGFRVEDSLVSCREQSGKLPHLLSTFIAMSNFELNIGNRTTILYMSLWTLFASLPECFKKICQLTCFLRFLLGPHSWFDSHWI